VFVNVYFPDDVFKKFYPAVYDNYPYWGSHTISSGAPDINLSTNDYILIENPFFNPANNTFLLARLKYIHQVIKNYQFYKFCAINEFNFTGNVEIFGTDVKITNDYLEYLVYNYLDLMCSLGVYAAGFADVDYGAQSNLLIDWNYKFENPYGIPDDVDIEKDDETGDIWITLKYHKYNTERKFYFKEETDQTYQINGFG
ncbi:MAG: hypothetical protein ABDI07_11690, partial [Candidatus Kryptonium sp.]